MALPVSEFSSNAFIHQWTATVEFLQLTPPSLGATNIN